jgi:hypothetical protein
VKITRVNKSELLVVKYLFDMFEKIFIYEKGAERAGFEPAIPVSQYDGLANRWFQPLTHLSELKNMSAKILL